MSVVSGVDFFVKPALIWLYGLLLEKALGLIRARRLYAESCNLGYVSVTWIERKDRIFENRNQEAYNLSFSYPCDIVDEFKSICCSLIILS